MRIVQSSFLWHASAGRAPVRGYCSATDAPVSLHVLKAPWAAILSAFLQPSDPQISGNKGACVQLLVLCECDGVKTEVSSWAAAVGSSSAVGLPIPTDVLNPKSANTGGDLCYGWNLTEVIQELLAIPSDSPAVLQSVYLIILEWEV